VRFGHGWLVFSPEDLRFDGKRFTRTVLTLSVFNYLIIERVL